MSHSNTNLQETEELISKMTLVGVALVGIVTVVLSSAVLTLWSALAGAVLLLLLLSYSQHGQAVQRPRNTLWRTFFRKRWRNPAQVSPLTKFSRAAVVLLQRGGALVLTLLAVWSLLGSRQPFSSNHDGCHFFAGILQKTLGNG